MTAIGTRPGFNHNDFYHPYLLRQVPPGCARALDVGCGTGLFTRRLAHHARSVQGIDRAPEMVATARALSAGIPNVSYVEADLLDLDLDSGRYNYIACIASIHHMPFAEAITRLREALAPGGVLAILGCYRQTTLPDYLACLVAIPLNLARNAAAKRTARRRQRSLPAAPPVMDPQMTLPQLKQAAQRLLPGAAIRRHLYWRYSLIYQRPSTQAR
jgi:SAM-dependent methyltransferase